MRRLWRFIKRLFVSERRRVPMPSPVPEAEVIEVSDGVNDGDWRNPDFQYLWDNLVLDDHRVEQIKDVCQEIIQSSEKYIIVANKIGCPWWYIAGLHYRESSLNFRGVLHNGQRILGTGRKTTWVPKGRGPFNTWEESAIDALRLKNYHTMSSWNIVECIIRAERFNGLGYRRKGWGEYSPYLFAGTNFHDETGKYISDGKYSDTAIEKQLGVCAIWLGLEKYYNVDLGKK